MAVRCAVYGDKSGRFLHRHASAFCRTNVRAEEAFIVHADEPPAGWCTFRLDDHDREVISSVGIVNFLALFIIGNEIDRQHALWYFCAIFLSLCFGCRKLSTFKLLVAGRTAQIALTVEWCANAFSLSEV